MADAYSTQTDFRWGPSASPESGRLAQARELFLTSEPIEPGVVRESILASWTRSRSWNVAADHIEMPYDPDLNLDTGLTRSANRVINDAGDQLDGEPMSIILTDSNGVVLERRTGDRPLRDGLDKISLAPGFSYAEQFVGTNGIGTALEGRGPAHVFGHEHYVEHLEDFACAGAPIRHPVTGKVVGVVDLTCWRVHANPAMVTAASAIAARIEEALLEQSGRREVALLQDYLHTCQRSRGAVLAISNDLVMMNDRAREILDPIDQVQLLAHAAEALGTGKRQLFVLDLPSGATARVLCKPSWQDSSVTGGVVQVHLQFTQSHASAGNPGPPAPLALPGAVGSGALWARCCHEVDRHFRSGEWLVLQGEAGVGKLSVARATHQLHAPAAHLRVFDAAEAVQPGTGEKWVEEVAEEINSDAGTIILRHVDQLPQDTLRALVDVLEPKRESTDPNRPWVVATCRGKEGSEEDLGQLLRCFPRSVEVPPLRHHIEDVGELVPFLINRLTRGADLRCSPEAMRVLMRNRWPGNVEQLYQTMRKIVSQRRTGIIGLRDLPPECRATARRVLTPLESMECDAIVECLINVGGNRAEAARQLGMSRATIYRKIRGYGITVPISSDA